MNPSSFEHIVRIQFNALMMTVIKCTVKNRNRHANYAQTECQFRYCGTAIPFLTVRSTAR